MDDKTAIREAFLSMIADAEEWEEQPDADVNDAGRLIDCTTFKLVTGHRQLAELCEAMGIEPKFEETLAQAIERYAAMPPVATMAPDMRTE